MGEEKAPGRAAAVGQVELRDLIRKRWNEVLTPPQFPDVDFAQASLAAEVALDALAAAAAAPRGDAGTIRHIPTGATWVTWDHRRQPPWEQVAEAVSRLTGGAVKIRAGRENDGGDPDRRYVAIYRNLPEAEDE